ncbi:Leukotriene A-4 hydrolase-like protein [Diplonema papillatum]|nr:Leukotriene A-4 hydrolase-like protein [Diplonema papillatum]
MDSVRSLRQTVGDPSTLSNITEVVTRHIALDWRVDFDKKQLRGTATLTLAVLQPCSEIVLDARQLLVENVLVNGVEAEWTMGEESEAFGRPIKVVAAGCVPDTTVSVRVAYSTSPDASALAWLDKQQTDSKEQPYLFSQCQAIHARSLLPCQDTPGVRATYSAKVTCPSTVVALMSALMQGDPVTEGGVTVAHFSQPVPISSYLLAIVCGKIEKRDISPTVAVWSEAPTVDKAAFDFSDTERFVQTGESLVGKYVWGRYDVVCLPGSFPYGGMENPCLTFVTPSLLTGDKSLADVVAHEVSHSWTGNLVGPLTWEDFYLNEGFTMFLERKILRRMYGEDTFQFSAVMGWNALKNSVELFGETHEYTVLRPMLSGVDPDDSFSVVPYEKGYSFISHLQSVVGDEAKFEAWLHAYIQAFAHQAITTADMLGHLFRHFSADGPGGAVDFSSVDFKAWIDGTGMPPVTPTFRSVLLDECTGLAEKWQVQSPEVSAADIEKWPSACVCHFLALVEEANPTAEQLTRMNELYKFNTSSNSEVLFRWLKLAIRSGWTGHEEVLRDFLARIGRMKFTRPLYRELGARDHDLAVSIFNENRAGYHNITAKMVAKDLKLA